MKKFVKTTATLLLAFSLLLGIAACADQPQTGGSLLEAQGNASGTNEGAPAQQEGALQGGADADPDAPKQKLRIGLAQDSNEPVGVAAAAIVKGYIDEELSKVGFEAEWFGFAAAGPAVNEALVGGSIDLAIYGNQPPVQLAGRGFDIRVISFGDPNLYFTTLVAPESPIQSLGDVEGKKVLVASGTIYEEYWRNLVEAYGIDESKVEIISDPANASQIFSSGDADVLITIDITKYIMQGRGIPLREIENNRLSHPEFASQSVIVGRGEFLDQNGDVATAFLRAYIRGHDYISENPDEIPELCETSTHSRELLEQIRADNPNYITGSTGGVTDEWVARLQQVAEFLVSNGSLSNELDVSTIIDDKYWREAYREIRGEEYNP